MANVATPARIRKLSNAAAEHGDLEMVAICERALGHEPTERVFDLVAAEFATMSQAEALAKCERALSDADAQAEA